MNLFIFFYENRWVFAACSKEMMKRRKIRTCLYLKLGASKCTACGDRYMEIVAYCSMGIKESLSFCLLVDNFDNYFVVILVIFIRLFYGDVEKFKAVYESSSMMSLDVVICFNLAELTKLLWPLLVFKLM